MTKLPNASEFQISPDDQKTHNNELSLLRFITCGSVDDGKSTLIGRMLFDAGQVFEDQIAALDDASTKYGTQGKNRDFALLVDGLSAEREQGITIDVAYRYFRTKRRAFIVADTPGHEQYTRNMATGASTAELAIILIDARKGILAQTRRHALIVSMLGVKKVVLAINKMDLVNYDQSTFNAIRDDFNSLSSSFNFTEIIAIPIAAKNGENILENSQNMAWYVGTSLLNHLENVEIDKIREQTFRFPVQWVNRPNLDFRGFSGYVSSGEIRTGQEIRVSSSGQKSKVSRIVTYDGDCDSAISGEAVTLTLEDEIDISRGDILSFASDTLRPKHEFEAHILWMSATPLQIGKEYIIKHAASETNASIKSLNSGTNFDNLKTEEVSALKTNGIGSVTILARRAMLLEPYQKDRELGSFILIDKQSNETIALGLVKETAAPKPNAKPNLERELAAKLLPNIENAEAKIIYGISWLQISLIVTFLIIFLLTQNLFIALAAALLEAIIKPIIQILHLRYVSDKESAKNTKIDEANIDGLGI